MLKGFGQNLTVDLIVGLPKMSIQTVMSEKLFCDKKSEIFNCDQRFLFLIFTPLGHFAFVPVGLRSIFHVLILQKHSTIIGRRGRA